MKKVLFFLLVIYSFISKSQIPFRGIVTEQNSSYTAIPNVQIKSDTSNTVSSDAKGNFNLLFQNKKEGDEVYLQAKKFGYEIVNSKEMATKIPKRQNSPFRVVKSKAGLLAQNKARYYGISEKYITRKYEKELAKLNRSTEGWREKAKQLEESFRSSLEFARELADKYSMMNLDDVSELQRKAFRLFEENKVEEALKILEGENYQENIKLVKIEQKKIQGNIHLADNEIAKAEEIIQQQISKLMFQADLYAQDFQFDKAEKTYEIAAEADTTNYDNTFDFAYFLNNQNQHDRAIKYYLRVLKLAPSESYIATTQNNLGVLYQTKNDYLAALKAYNRALEISERLAKTNPATYERGVANTQNNLGRLYQGKNEYPAALNAYSKALEIRERLAKTNPAIYEPDVAMTQNNLGVFYEDKNEYPAALNAYSKALKIRERLAKINPAIYEPEVAATQNNLGSLYHAKNDYPAAVNACTKAFEIYERLAETNPATYEPDLAMTQNNLGLLYEDKNDYPAALNAYIQALDIYERLVKTNPATYEPFVAMTQNNLGNLYEDKNDYPAALNAYGKALEIRTRLVKTNPATYEPDLASTQNNLGLLYQAKNDYPAAMNAYTQALEIYAHFAKTNPDTYEPDVARTQNNLGILYKAKKDYPAALNAYSRAL